MQPQSIYQRFKALKLKPATNAMFNVGVIVSKIYYEAYGRMPEKRICLIDKLEMNVNVYPSEFIPKVDKQIINYCFRRKSDPAKMPAAPAPIEITAVPSQAQTQAATGPQEVQPIKGKRERKRIIVKRVEPLFKASQK